MNNYFNFLNISQYNNYVININKNDYKKMQDCINKLKQKYNNEILNLYNLEKINSKKFDFQNQRNFIIKHKETLVNIINDVLKIYNNELKNLIVVFLSGSFARGTNKMSSDIDLHFFYKDNNYNYVYEEIVCYIISRIVNKSRDCIDPTFIFNIEKENKFIVTSKMDKSKLNIILKYKNKEIKYSYKYGKKRRFYLQYINTRDINKLFNYLKTEIIKHNDEWCHCFEIIKGKSVFNELYENLYKEEINIINSKYIIDKINELKEELSFSFYILEINSISEYKKYYQSKVFELIYKYISILRFILINQEKEIKYLNLLEIHDIIETNSIINKNILIEIYKYMWNLEKLTIYCHENNINYGLHNDDSISYPKEELDLNLKKLKDLIINDLERLKNI